MFFREARVFQSAAAERACARPASCNLEMAPRKSPRDSVCPHCRRSFTKGGLRQHLKYVKCAPTSDATPREFDRVRCKHCGKSFHSTNSLRVHVSTVHAKEYAKSPASMKLHRAPYHGKRRNGVTGPSQRRSPTHHSPHAAPRAPHHLVEHAPVREHADGPRQSAKGVVRGTSDAERRGHTHPIEKATRASPRPATEHSWERQLGKKLAEAASRK